MALYEYIDAHLEDIKIYNDFLDSQMNCYVIDRERIENVIEEIEYILKKRLNDKVFKRLLERKEEYLFKRDQMINQLNIYKRYFKFHEDKIGYVEENSLIKIQKDNRIEEIVNIQNDTLVSLSKSYGISVETLKVSFETIFKIGGRKYLFKIE